jgi:2,3-bisphosphoglycerate-dependent phosphoglycerate mutase
MVRHGESPYNEGNERTRGLTPKGKLDIEKVTKLLIGEGIDMIISSPYTRAILSVEGLAEYLKLDIKVFENLRERHFSSFIIDNADLMSSIRESFNDFDYTLPGGESNAACQKRAISVLKPILKERRGIN